jgi:hypothetical protein
MPTTSLGPRASGWRRPVAVPGSFSDLRGPATGHLRLPLRTYSSGAGPARSFDLSDEAQRLELYQIVLTDGTVDDICEYVNPAELLRVWERLWLPVHVRRAWEPLLSRAAS